MTAENQIKEILNQKEHNVKSSKFSETSENWENILKRILFRAFIYTLNQKFINKLRDTT